MTAWKAERVAGSFRDPSGFLFYDRDHNVCRQVNDVYRGNLDLLNESGLYTRLVTDTLLIPHVESAPGPEHGEEAYRILTPEQLEFVSYPYEWCFSQLKDAAILTLTIQKRALEHGMVLKDASAYNVQFRGGRPVFIDSLSFEPYVEGEPWVAYRQFCQHFVAPLALMSRTDVRLSQLLRVFIDGVPLDLASRLLPVSTRLRLPLLIHIHLHARAEARYGDGRQSSKKSSRVSRQGLLGLVENLESALKKLEWQPEDTQWSDYYSDTNYSREAADHKAKVVRDFLSALSPRSVWDLGANTGQYSRLAASLPASTLSFDMDPGAVEINYRTVRENGEKHLLPLVLDVANPSPGIGWANTERTPLFERGRPDVIMALALVHHLAITNNLPLSMVASLLAESCEALIIEFVPKQDSQVQRLLAARADIFPHYDQGGFEREFGKVFRIRDKTTIADSERTLYLMEKQ